MLQRKTTESLFETTCRLHVVRALLVQKHRCLIWRWRFLLDNVCSTGPKVKESFSILYWWLGHALHWSQDIMSPFEVVNKRRFNWIQHENQGDQSLWARSLGPFTDVSVKLASQKVLPSLGSSYVIWKSHDQHSQEEPAHTSNVALARSTDPWYLRPLEIGELPLPQFLPLFQDSSQIESVASYL